MNNSKIALDYDTLVENEATDRLPFIRERITQVTENLKAVDGLLKNDDWKWLEANIFKPAVERLEKELLDEAKKDEINQAKLYRTQGSLMWAKTHSDLQKFGERLKLELIALRKELKKHESRTDDGASTGSSY